MWFFFWGGGSFSSPFGGKNPSMLADEGNLRNLVLAFQRGWFIQKPIKAARPSCPGKPSYRTWLASDTAVHEETGYQVPRDGVRDGDLDVFPAPFFVRFSLLDVWHAGRLSSFHTHTHIYIYILIKENTKDTLVLHSTSKAT